MSRGIAVLLACILLVGLVQVAASNPLSGHRLYVDPNSDAARQAKEWARSRPADAARMRNMAEQPLAKWLGAWSGDVRNTTSNTIKQAGSAIPVFVVYNIPHRDCGSHSAGGARNANDYRRWITDIARGIGDRPAVVVLEPDALAGSDCMPLRLRSERYGLLRSAVDVLSKTGAHVYIDAGHPRWLAASEIADRLGDVGVAGAAGFSLNVSNYQPTSLNVTYGTQVSRLTNGRHFVIDTSRNGAGTAGKEWCNPARQALGPRPTTNTRQPLVDAYLWIKVPGQSDGKCGGGPAAGKWWADYALELSKAADAVGAMVPR